jgi:hypothetical protein
VVGEASTRTTVRRERRFRLVPVPDRVNHRCVQISDRHTYAATVDAVLAMLADEQAIRQRYEGMGHRDVEILECTRAPDSLRIRTSRVVDVELPSFAKKVLKPTNTMVQTDEWVADGAAWAGTFSVEVRGAPVKIHGRMQLDADGRQSTHAVTIDMEVKVPLVGGKIADWIGKNDATRTLQAEFAAGDDWLRDHA